jgi:hypothetical protein
MKLHAFAEVYQFALIFQNEDEVYQFMLMFQNEAEIGILMFDNSISLPVFQVSK